MQDHTTFKYNGRGSLNLQGSNSTNGAANRSSAGGGIDKHDEHPDRERHHLLNLKDSEINDSEEDLKLPIPSATQSTSFKTSAGAITNGVTTAAGRIRRKIRLNRYIFIKGVVP